MWVERIEHIYGDVKDIHLYIEQLKKEYGSDYIKNTTVNYCNNAAETDVTITYNFLVNKDTFVKKCLTTKITNKQGNVVKVLNSAITTLCDIKKVIFNAPATIVFWEDGTKTVVKADEEDYDPEKGLAMAIAKKSYGNKGNYFNIFKKWLSNIKGE